MQPSNSCSGQGARIFALLIAARDGWVGLPEIFCCAAQYNARIYEVGRVGHRIEDKTEQGARRRHSWVRLVQGLPAAPIQSEPCPTPTPAPSQQPFDSTDIPARLDNLAEVFRFAQARQRARAGGRR